MGENPEVLDIPWKVKLQSSIFFFMNRLSRRSDGSFNRFLWNLMDIKSPPSKKPINGVTTADVTVDKARNRWFRVYTPIPGGDTMPVIVYFHGGGGVYGNADSKFLDEICSRFARELSAIVVSVNYRLAPEHRYPIQIEDCFEALKFIDETETENFLPIHANLKHCFLTGDSGGGNLVHQVLIKASKHKFQSIKIRGGILIQPGFGGEERTGAEIRLEGKVPYLNKDVTDWLWKCYLPEGSDRDHPACNVFGPNSDDISGFKIPPIVIFVGGLDPLQDWQKRYYERLKRYGKEAYLIEYPNAFHSFYVYPELPESSLLIKDAKDFMQKQLEAESTSISVPKL